MKTVTKATALSLTLLSCLVSGGTSYAGESTDKLTACLVRSASKDDRIVLVRWIFSAMARYPSISNMANVSDAQRVEVSRNGGQLFSRLLTSDCAAETKLAFKNDGYAAIETAFGVLGETAMSDIMDHPDVQASIAELGAYVDENALQEVLISPN